jgi:hypothetical protein
MAEIHVMDHSFIVLNFREIYFLTLPCSALFLKKSLLNINNYTYNILGNNLLNNKIIFINKRFPTFVGFEIQKYLSIFQPKADAIKNSKIFVILK